MSQINAASILREAGRLYGRYLSSVLGLSALIQISYVILSIIAMDMFGLAGLALASLLSLVAMQLTIGVLTLLVVQVRLGDEIPPATELIKAVLPRMLSLFGLAIVVSLRSWLGFVVGFLVGGIVGAVVGGSSGAAIVGLLGSVGLGMYLYVTASIAAPALVAGRMGIGDSIRTSNALVKPQFFSVLVVAIAQVAILIAGSLISRHVAADDGAFEDVFIAQAVVTAADLTPITDVARGARVEATATLLGLPAFTPRTAAALAPLAGTPPQLVAAALASPENAVSA